MTAIERPDPPKVADERTMLNAWLDFHRATLVQKCEGLDREQLTMASCPPSDLSLLGLVRHMSEVERGWFRNWAGEDVHPLYYDDSEGGDPDGDFHPSPDVDADADFATFVAECDHSRELADGAASLDQIGQRQRHGQDVSLRWILVHMIEEYARHNGHADLIRERIDGVTGD